MWLICKAPPPFAIKLSLLATPFESVTEKRNLSPSFTVSDPASIGISKFKLKPLELYEPCNLPFTDVKSNHWPSSPFSAEINFTL